jgi:hypothetical protein
MSCAFRPGASSRGRAAEDNEHTITLPAGRLGWLTRRYLALWLMTRSVADEVLHWTPQHPGDLNQELWALYQLVRRRTVWVGGQAATGICSGCCASKTSIGISTRSQLEGCRSWGALVVSAVFPLFKISQAERPWGMWRCELYRFFFL